MEEREEGEQENEDDDARLSKSTVSKHTLRIPTFFFFFQEDYTTDSHPNSSSPKTLVFYVKLFLSIPVYKTLTLQ